MTDKRQTKEAVSVAEMARMVSLSRARFYQLMKAGVFPEPQRHSETGRPFYSEEQQRTCLEVRRRNCGVNGKAVLFYARKVPATPSPARRPARGKPAGSGEYARLVEGVRLLGHKTVTASEVAEAVKQLYPQGTAGAAEAEVVTKIFLHLWRRD